MKNIKLLFCPKTEREFFVFVKDVLGFYPKSAYLYRKALTHKSAFIKSTEGHFVCNERLEYLGDSILDSIIADYLFKRYPDKDEGFLTKMRSKIVNRKSLNELGSNLKLEKYLIANNFHTQNNNAIGNAFESLIGALYLDRGYVFTRKFVIKNIIERYLDFNYLEKVDNNFKSQLIEIVQKNKGVICFDTIECSENLCGQFISVVNINDSKFCEATGKNKKDAEQNASRIALQLIQSNNF